MIASENRNGPQSIASDRGRWSEKATSQPNRSLFPYEYGERITQAVATFVNNHPGTSLLCALTLGGLAGWILKRRK